MPCYFLSQVVPLVEESRALSFALTMTLAATPAREFGGEQVDALCQLAYELQRKLTNAVDLLHDAGMVSDQPTGGAYDQEIR